LPVGLVLLGQGLVIGLAVAAPVGPISVLIMQRTMRLGRHQGWLAGLGVATADALYGAVAGFGLTAISGVLLNQQGWLRLVGGLFLVWLGLRVWLTAPASRAATERVGGAASAFGVMLLLTLTNPATILSFAAIFAGFGLGETGGDFVAAGALVSGVFIGSALWWLALTSLIGRLRRRLTPTGLRWINRGAGGVILVAGLVALVGILPR
jgi:threonine/homoserine/homoserine lactone efflux protein